MEPQILFPSMNLSKFRHNTTSKLISSPFIRLLHFEGDTVDFVAHFVDELHHVLPGQRGRLIGLENARR